MQFNDYYRTLELDLTATASEIRYSYRRLAHKYHPDISLHANCDRLFKDVTEAYAVLKNIHRHSSNDSWHKTTKRIDLEPAKSPR